MEFPANVSFVLKTIEDAGFKSYLVGGCVRDFIMGREPNDYDIATDAKPEKIKLIFDKTIDTGIKHGTVTVLINNDSFEVTTLRLDGEYKDNRRPENIIFTDIICEDLSRRDFTCNAIAFSQNEGIIDPFNGISDIKNKILRAVGQPSKRYQEDALRMLRAIRFSSQLGFEIEDKTYIDIRENSKLISNISAERVRDELNKILIADPENFKLLYDCRMLEYILPEFLPCFNTEQQNPWHMYDVATHILKSVSLIEKDIILRWTMLLHDIGKPSTKTTDEKGIDHFYGHPKKSVEISEKILKRLKFDNQFIKKVLKFIYFHDRQVDADENKTRKLVAAIGVDMFMDLMKVKIADSMAQNLSKSNKTLKIIEEVKKVYFKVVLENQCLTIGDLAVNGEDLICLGVKKGKEIGEILNILLEKVLENPILNTREKLLDEVKCLIF